MSDVVLKLKDLSRSHQAVTHALIKVVISRKRCKIETLLRVYRIAPFLMTLKLIHLSPYKSFLNDFSYSCAAVDKISTNLGRRAVPLR